MKAVILAGGLGLRLKPFTQVIPKPLLPIGEKSMLQIQIERLAKYGFKEIFLATNYKSEYIERFFGDGSDFGVSLKISREETPLGTAGPLHLLRDQLDSPFVVMNGDILSLIDFGNLYDFACSQDSLLTLTIKKEITPFDFGNIFFDGNRVTGIEEKPDIVMYILAGIYVMKPEIFRFFPENKFFGMDMLIKSMLDQGEVISKFDLKDYWLDIGRIDDYYTAQSDYNSHFNSSK
ncbi:MAG: NTP transferase domain-containing protein [Chlorobiaceae bacterium]|nr:NTP transferase domain-containing protein [Chlorobiaceae bacterium]NTW73707.1 NTP transferase domain-containing protein [Chlorobiaceae bacterium]